MRFDAALAKTLVCRCLIGVAAAFLFPATGIAQDRTSDLDRLAIPSADGRFPMPDLRDPELRPRIDLILKRRCGLEHGLTQTQIPSDLPENEFVSQSPEAGASTDCNEAKVVNLSSGIAAQPSAAPVRIGDLSDPLAIATLARDAAAMCDGALLDIRRQTRIDPLPAGSFLGQDPAPDVIYACGMALTVVASAGPGPAAAPIWTMPDLGVAGALDALQAQAKARCGRTLAVTTEAVDVDRATGTSLQDPAAGRPIGCDTRVWIGRVEPGGPQPWLFALGALAIVGVGALALAAVRAVRSGLHTPTFAIAAGVPKQSVSLPPEGLARAGPDLMVSVRADPPALSLEAPLDVIHEEVADD